jgi:hypothetical protein
MLYWLLVAYHCVKYPLFFFLRAPVTKWHTVIASTWRVATSVAYSQVELRSCADHRDRAVRLHEMMAVVGGVEP